LTNNWLYLCKKFVEITAYIS